MVATARPTRKEPKVRNQRALGIPGGRPAGPVPVLARHGKGGARGHRQFREDGPSWPRCLQTRRVPVCAYRASKPS
jgi:hypothetical protein